jgi:hypothetical protein
MAASKRYDASKTIHHLCLPRQALADMFQLFDIHEDNDRKKEDRRTQIFGKPPYSFIDDDHMTELPAPKREFGNLSLSLEARKKIYEGLPMYMKDALREDYDYPTFIGYYVDGRNRVYKREVGNVWTVLIDDTHQDWPFVGVEIKLHHVYAEHNFNVVVMAYETSTEVRRATARILVSPTFSSYSN